MKFKDERAAYVSRINLATSRVLLSHPIVFMCGGKTISPIPTSVRGALVQRIHSKSPVLSSALKLAEDIKDWLHDAVYKDLLVFETDIAQISSLVVIVLESAGSLTELGLFVRNEHLKDKIVVFVSEYHYEEESFVKMGPLRYLERHNSASVASYPWCRKEDGYMDMSQEFRGALDLMISDIEGVLSKQDKSVAFDKGNEGHISFFIFEMLLVFRALKFTEIVEFLSCLDFSVGNDLVRRLLFLLGKFGLVGERKRGHTTYYYATSDVSRIEFGGKLDATEATLSAMRFYVTNPSSEAQRTSVISSVYPGPDSGGAK